jgi:hypothetical protein
MALLILMLLIVVGLMVYYHHIIFDSFGVFVSVDVLGRRNVNEAEILDEWLIAHFNSYSDKDVFENLQSLLSVARPDLLESSLRLIDDKSSSSTALMINNEISMILVSKNDVINKKTC